MNLFMLYFRLVFMTDAKKHQIAKESWGKWSFYTDIIVFLIIGVCLYLLIQNSYNAGMLIDEPYMLSQAWFAIAGIVGLLAICLTWIFFRLYRYRGQLERRYR